MTGIKYFKSNSVPLRHWAASLSQQSGRTFWSLRCHWPKYEGVRLWSHWPSILLLETTVGCRSPLSDQQHRPAERELEHLCGGRVPGQSHCEIVKTQRFIFCFYVLFTVQNVSYCFSDSDSTCWVRPVSRRGLLLPTSVTVEISRSACGQHPTTECQRKTLRHKLSFEWPTPI